MMFKRLWIFLTLMTLSLPSYAIGATIAVGLGMTLASGALTTAGMITAFAINMVVSAAIGFAFQQALQPSASGLDTGSAAPDTGNRLQVSPNTANKLPVIYGTAWTGGIITDMSITDNNQVIYYVISLCEVTGTDGVADSYSFGDVWYGGKKVNFGTQGVNYSAAGQILSYTSNSITVSSSGSDISVGSRITFANSGSPTQYTVSSISYDYGYDQEGGSFISSTRMTFSTSISGASVGGQSYLAQNYDNRTSVVSLTDTSTGEVDTTVNGKINIYLYSNGSENPYNTSLSAIAVMQSSGLEYKWDANKQMSNCAFAIVKLKYSITANIRGINQTKFQIINPRTKPGDVVLDYLLNERYGCAIPLDQIDTAALTALNTYADQSVTYVPYSGGTATLTRYRFNGQLDTGRNCMDNLQDMMNCCDSILKYNDIYGKWSVIVNKNTYTVAMDINDSNMVSALTITPLDIAASYNYIEVKFPDNTNQDSFNTANFDLAEIDPTLLYPNEPVNKISVNLPYVNDNVRAQMIANRMLKVSREDLQVTAQVNFIGLQLEAGDVVTVTNANYGWVAKLFRLTKVTETFNDDGSIVVKLVMAEFNPAVYDDVSVTQFSPAPNSGIGDPTFFGSPPAPLVVAEYATASNPSFVVSVKTPPSGITQYMEVWYSAYATPTDEQIYFAGTSEVQANGNPWNVSTFLPNITISNIPAGNWYLFSRAVNNLASSAFSSPSAILRWRPATYQFTQQYLVVAYADSITGTGFSFSPTGKSYYGLANQDNVSPSTNPNVYTWYLAEPTFGTTIFLCYCNRGNRKFSFDTGFAALAAGSGAFVPTQAALFDPSLWSALPNGTNYIDLDHRTGQLLETGTTTVGTGQIAVTNTTDGRVVASLEPYLNFGTGIYQYTSAVATLTVDIYGRVVGFEPPDNFYYSEQIFTATAGQTVFSVTRGSGYIVGQCWVLVNGSILQPTTDYVDAASTVTLTSGVAAGSSVTVLSYKSSNSTAGVYASFTRHDVTLTNASSYSPSGFTITSGYEFLFLNGIQLNEQEYDIVAGDIIGFPSLATGTLTIIEWSKNNLNLPNGNPINVLAYTAAGQSLYPFSYDPNAFNLYENGVFLTQGADFTTSSGNYTLVPTPTETNILVQQTFASAGVV